MLESIVAFIVDTIGGLGYTGVFVLMFLESSLFPFPSEVVMVPAGYLASLGQMNLAMSIIVGTAGSTLGAVFNYYLGYIFGRKVILRFGRYFFFKKEKLEYVESLFKKHGEIITFIGRLIPGVRQVISFPPGMARMNMARFLAFTALGAGIWVIILTILGFAIGENIALVHTYLTQITYLIIVFSGISILVYIWVKKRRSV